MSAGSLTAGNSSPLTDGAASGWRIARVCDSSASKLRCGWSTGKSMRSISRSTACSWRAGARNSEVACTSQLARRADRPVGNPRSVQRPGHRERQSGFRSGVSQQGRGRSRRRYDLQPSASILRRMSRARASVRGDRRAILSQATRARVDASRCTSNRLRVRGRRPGNSRVARAPPDSLLSVPQGSAALATDSVLAAEESCMNDTQVLTRYKALADDLFLSVV